MNSKTIVKVKKSTRGFTSSPET